MNKQEILKRASQEGEYSYDERELSLLEKSAHLAMLMGGIVCMVLIFVFNHIVDYPEISSAVLIVYLSMQATENFFIYKYIKRRFALIKTIICCVLTLVFIALLVYLLLK